MSRLRAAIDLARLGLRSPGRLLKGLYHLSTIESCRHHVVSGYGLAEGLPQVDLLELLGGKQQLIGSYSFLDGTSRPTDIALLRGLASRTSCRRYIEFGTWRGESLANVAPLVEEAWAISFSVDQMRSAGMPESAVKAAHFFSGELPNRTLIEANTQTYDYSELEGKFDLVFVDADHEHPGVTIDTRNAFRLLRDEHSVIVWHDYGKDYETVNWPVLRGILDGCPDDAHRGRIRHVSNTLCAIYTRQDLPAYRPERFLPDKVFDMTLNVQRPR